MTFTLANLRAAGSFNGPMTVAPAAPRPTIQDYRDALDALIPYAESRAEDLSDHKANGDEDPEFPGADAAWEAVEAARALMAGHAPDAAPAAPQTPDASALMLAALRALTAETAAYLDGNDDADMQAAHDAACEAIAAAEGAANG